MIDGVIPRCVKWLLNDFGHQGLSEEDCEDCVGHGVKGLLERESSQVDDPYNYIFTSAKNAAIDILLERRFVVRYDPEWLEDDNVSSNDWSEVPQPGRRALAPEAMLFVAEAALDVAITARTEQLQAIFRVAMFKLPANRRRLVEVLLEHGPTTANVVLADIMERSETAIKSLKSRTFEDLRGLLPASADELGIDFDLLLASEPEALARNRSIPSDEDDSDFVP